MLLKLLLQPWMTVVRMTKVSGSSADPEDAKKSPLNPTPTPGQLEPNDYVERSRRMNLNDLENIPAFLVAGLLFVLVDPPLLMAQVLLWLFVAARAAHFVAYATARTPPTFGRPSGRSARSRCSSWWATSSYGCWPARVAARRYR